MKIGIVGFGKMGSIYGKVLVRELGYEPEDIVISDVLDKETEVEAEGHMFVTSLRHVAREVDTVIVAVNTPSHISVIEKLAENGVKNIFCEKPLGMSFEEVSRLDSLVAEGVKICTAFLINFSPAVKMLVDLMEDENLVLREGSSIWGKNRVGDSRPTPGDLEDEVIHPFNVFQMLAGVNSHPLNMGISARLSFMDYVDKSVQEKAREIDPSFPGVINSSSNILIDMLVSDGIQDDSNLIVPIVLRSSYIMARQARMMEGVLGSFPNSDFSEDAPVYSFAIDFDVEGKDVLTITRLDDNEVSTHHLQDNKIARELEAFLVYVDGGGMDSRLTGFRAAKKSVLFTDAAFQSHINMEQFVI